MSAGAREPSRPREAPGGIVEPATLLKLIEDSGHSFPVIEQAVRLLRRGLARVDTGDPALVEILRAHLLAVGSPTDVTKYFSLELLERASPAKAEETSVEVAELLARSPLVAERGYHVERAVLRSLGESKVTRALPALALLASRCVFPISRTAARAVVAITGSGAREEIAQRLAACDLPGESEAKELAQGVARALAEDVRRSSRGSDGHKRRSASGAVPRPASVSAEQSDRFLRPEPKPARQARLRGILREAGRDPSRCGNCDLAGKNAVVHVVPESRGGSDRPGNLVALCPDCKKRLPRKKSASASPSSGGAPQLTLFG